MSEELAPYCLKGRTTKRTQAPPSELRCPKANLYLYAGLAQCCLFSHCFLIPTKQTHWSVQDQGLATDKIYQRYLNQTGDFLVESRETEFPSRNLLVLPGHQPIQSTTGQLNCPYLRGAKLRSWDRSKRKVKHRSKHRVNQEGMKVVPWGWCKKK